MLLFKNKYKLDKKIDNFFFKNIMEKKKDLVLNLDIIFENTFSYSKYFRNVKLKYKLINIFDYNSKIFLQFIKDFFSFDFFLFFNLKYIDSIFNNYRLNFFVCYFNNNINFFNNLTNLNIYNIFNNYKIINSYINLTILKIFFLFSFYKGFSKNKFKISEFIVFFYSFKFFFKFIFDFSINDKNVKKFLHFFRKFKSRKRNKFRKNYIYNKFNNIFFYFYKYKKYNKNNFAILKKIKQKYITKNFNKIRLSKKFLYFSEYSQKLNKFKNNRSILNILKIK